MRALRRPRLCAELLEDRFCPSLALHVTSGTLYISGTPAGNVLITETANNVSKVQDNGKPLGTFVASTVNMNLASHPGTVDLNLNAFTLAGNLLLNAGTGVHGSPGTSGIGIRNGAIGGSVSVQGGSGNETLNLGTDGTGNNATPVRIGCDVTFAPRANPAPGLVNTFDSQDSTAPVVTIGGSLSISNTAQIAVGVNTTVGHDVSVTVGTGLPLTLFDVGTINRNLSVTSTGTTSNIKLGSAGKPARVLGSVTANLGNGNDTFSFIPGSTVGGNATITTGTGNDTVSLDGAVAGNLSLNAGDGTDAVEFSGSVSGTLGITDGSGNDSITLTGTAPGAVNVTTGSGTDTITVTTVPGGLLTFRGGNGGDSLTLNGKGNYHVNVVFGSGDDSFTIDIGAGNTLTGLVDGGSRVAANVFTQTSGNVDPGTITNFP